MARVVGYICSDDRLTGSVVDTLGEEFGGPRTEPDAETARGFGWVQEGRSLLRKQPPQGRIHGTLGALMSDIRARELVGFEREYDRGVVDTLDLQPFCYRTWAYTQSEQVQALEEQRGAARETIPDHIRRNIKGDTTEELCFHLFLNRLGRAGGFGLSMSNPSRCAEALARAIHDVESFSEGAQPPGEVVTVSERLLMGATTSGPLWMRRFEGIEEQKEEPLFAGHRPQVEKHPRFKAVLVTNDVHDPSEQWEQLPERSIFWVGGDWELHTEPLESFLD